MPIQAPQWTDYLSCPVCCREFGAPPRSPISLGCGHTLCRHCLKHLHRKQCPFDQSLIQVEPEELVVNTALLQLAGYPPPAQPYHPPSIRALPESDRRAYDKIVQCMEHLAMYLKYCGNASGGGGGASRLSRPMQRKLVTLVQCTVTDAEGRGRTARAARSLGERTVTELILQHQNPQQLSANLWAAVRARGCQFLGPAMQEEVLKLVLLALEDGSALSRKVLVMFVVQRLEPHFPQASKTSIGHVVQLLYRASCFKVSKRECDSSLMQLKEEFRTYESLRREHDAQIVLIATEAGLRIAPDQWSALLYGDTAHKSHMQSIIDKLQTPQSFAQSVQELFIALQRTGDPAQLVVYNDDLDRLAAIDPSPEATGPSWEQLADQLQSLKDSVSGLVMYLHQQAAGRDANHNQKHAIERPGDPSTSQLPPNNAANTPTHSKYKVLMCRDAATRSFCPRGNSCTFAHSEEELERYRGAPSGAPNGNYPYLPPLNAPPPGLLPAYPPRYPPPHHAHPPPHPHDGYGAGMSIPALNSLPPPEYEGAAHAAAPTIDDVPTHTYPPPLLHGQMPMWRFGNMLPRREPPSPPAAAGFVRPVYTQGPSGGYRGSEPLPPQLNMYVPVGHEPPRNISPYPFDVDMPSELGEYRMPAASFPRTDPTPVWPPTNEVFNFDNMRSALPHCSSTADDMFGVGGDRRAVGTDRLPTTTDLSNLSIRADDQELEEELQALERRIDTEFKSAD